MIKHFEVGLLEQVRIRIIIVKRRDEECVDAEEGTELRDEVLLLYVCARGRRDPKLLRVALYRVLSLCYYLKQITLYSIIMLFRCFILTVIRKLMNPRAHTIVRHIAMKQAVNGFDADRYPILKKTLFRTPMNDFY